jgi:hypothetical protein
MMRVLLAILATVLALHTPATAQRPLSMLDVVALQGTSSQAVAINNRC